MSSHFRKGGGWAQELINTGVPRLFRFADIPEELQDRGRFHQARVNAYIKKEKKIPTDGASVILWRNCIK